MDPKRHRLARQFQIIVYVISGIGLGYIWATFTGRLLGAGDVAALAIQGVFIGGAVLCAWFLAKRFLRETLPLEFFLDQEQSGKQVGEKTELAE